MSRGHFRDATHIKKSEFSEVIELAWDFCELIAIRLRGVRSKEPQVTTPNTSSLGSTCTHPELLEVCKFSHFRWQLFEFVVVNLMFVE